MASARAHSSMGRILAATAVVAVGTLLAATFFQTCLSLKDLSSNLISPATWSLLAVRLGGVSPTIPKAISIPFWLTLLPCAAVAAITWLGGAAILARRLNTTFVDALVRWGWYGWGWWCLIELWEGIWIVTGILGSENLAGFVSLTPQFWLAGCLACWLTTGIVLGHANQAQSVATSPTSGVSARWLWLVCAVYFVIFTAMNWRLYFNLLVPHGDSVMYEEHLWNLLHGKGFRSYLDQGLFLGEHIQFVHLFLLPLYLLWPSHLLLEACSSAALALGAFPVYWMVRRQTGSGRAALAVAVAYLLYAPMQALDIEIDLKTFRPESFGIPLLLLTLDQLDRRNLIGTCLGLAMCLTVKEDYTIVFGPLGLWIACTAYSAPRSEDQSKATASTKTPKQWHNPKLTLWQCISAGQGGLATGRSRLVFGLSLSVFSVFYLWLATRVMMPWFRSGVEVHYASYFARFGKTPEEIVTTMLSHPGMLFDALLNIETVLYGLELLAPLALIPLLAPGRLAVGLPLFGILCLNELDGSRNPHHQFHAPLVAILFWTLSAALPTAARLANRWRYRTANPANGQTGGLDVVSQLVWTSTLMTGLFFSISPQSIAFWDPGSSWSWQKLYGSNPRGEMFARIQPLIPPSARVASTDFVHPRFTHYDRSYDYSNYRRKVSGEGKTIPDDAEFLVIDTGHRYSTIKRASEIPELRDHPDEWQLLSDETKGDFIVLRRNKTGDQSAPAQKGVE